MKFLKFFLVFLAAGFVFTSCQKELSFESGNAMGSLKKDGTGECMPITVNGNYVKDTVLKAVNYVDVQVNITLEGTYNITTDTVNGYSFHATGTVAVTGLNTIRLQGSGTPLIAGVDVFTVKFDTSVCEFNVVVTNVPTAPVTPAVYTFGTGPGTSCTGAVLAGVYNSGMAMTSANTVTVAVSVTIPGSYNITTTSPVTGVTFAGTGTFATAGTGNVLLTATGIIPASPTPVTVSYTTSDVASGVTGCTFDVTYAAAAPPAVFTINCAGATLAGDYIAGTAMTSSNTVTLSVNVTTPGSYSVTTSANGVNFTGTGTFTTTGTQPLVLTGFSTPTDGGNFTYTVSGSTGSCTFDVLYDFVKATIDGTAKTFFDDCGASYDLNNLVPGADILFIGGYVNAGDEAMSIALAQPTGTTFTTGTYTVNQFASNILVAGDYTTAAAVDYVAQTDGTVQTPPFTITITSISSTRVAGTFSGPVKDNDGAGPGVKVVTLGSFNVKIQ